VSDRRILIIEDDPDVRLGLVVRLRASHFQVAFAGNAASGLATAAEFRPDLIVLDLGLPGDDGYVVLERISQSAELATIPIIVLSAWNRYAHEQRVRTAGAKAFCQKPVDDNELLARIQQILGTSAEPQPGPSILSGAGKTVQERK
jgi:DNA-binding response OmpR family regulator